MAMVRWSQAQNPQRVATELDRLFGMPFQFMQAVNELSNWAPAIEMYETPEDLVIRAIVPGAREEDLELTMQGDQFTLRGRVLPPRQPEDGKWTWYRTERRYGAFARTVALPVPVIADQAAAHLEHGILTITLPKALEVRPRTIKINGHNGQSLENGK